LVPILTSVHPKEEVSDILEMLLLDGIGLEPLVRAESEEPLDARISQTGPQMRVRKARVPSVVSIENSFLFCLFKHHQAAIWSLDRVVSISDGLCDKFYSVLVGYTSNVLRFGNRIPTLEGR